MSIVDELTKKRWLRVFNRRRRAAQELGQQADKHIERLLIRRFERLVSVRRFILLWIILFSLLLFCSVLQVRSLSSYYQSLQPVPGGQYAEGLVGSFTTANPLYATGAADSVISRLVFSGLFKYDRNNNLTGDLAQSWSLNPTQKRYTVQLKNNITWQDGKPFTSEDVVFTYQTIQNIAAQSPLYSNWKDITVSKDGDYSVNFDLPNALSSFPYALTNGIVPAHLLAAIPVEQLRSASFNTNPVGTGPFDWKFVEVTGTELATREQRISLAAFDHYWAGRPKLDGFSLITYKDEQRLIAAFQKKQLNGMSGLQQFSPELDKDKSIQAYTTPLTSAVMAFFNNSRQFLKDTSVRQALVKSVDRQQLMGTFKYPTYPVNGPLLRGQVGYDPSLTQLSYNLNKAKDILDKDGWKKDSNGQLTKDGEVLALGLTTQDTSDYTWVARFLQQQWAQLGIKVIINYYNADDLQSQIISNHDYDILLYGINIGVDPDVFAYWDSSQASVSSQGHLNLSEYKSKAVDRALESGRTRSSSALRVPKYKTFQSIWAKDAPALALYQPNFLYITRGPVFGYQHKADNSAVSRLYSVNEWMIRQQRQNIN